MTHENCVQRRVTSRLAWMLCGFIFAFAPVQAFAERAEIDCGTLPDAEQQQFYDLSGEAANAAGEGNLDLALQKAKAAMALCTTDVYTEYTLARIYQLSEDCPNAYYHFDHLMKRPSSVQKHADNVDIYKEVKKAFKSIKSKCGDVVLLDITCDLPGTELTINGLPSMANYSCPVEMMVKPGSYTVVSQKEGYKPRKDAITVEAGVGKVLRIPALKDASSVGRVVVKCPRGASKFELRDDKGNTEEYVCPWEGELPAGKYSVRLGGDSGEGMEMTVVEKDRTEYMIPNVAKANCSAAPLSGSSAPVRGMLFAILSALGMGALLRRRRSDS